MVGLGLFGPRRTPRRYKVSGNDSEWESKRKQLAMKSAFYSPFFRIEWAMWANEKALYGGLSEL